MRRPSFGTIVRENLLSAADFCARASGTRFASGPAPEPERFGLALAVLGIYGITSYSVVQRTQQLAVRMAMGADDVAIVRIVLAQALRLVVSGGGGVSASDFSAAQSSPRRSVNS